MCTLHVDVTWACVVPNHRQIDCLFTSLLSLATKMSKHRITGPLWGESTHRSHKGPHAAIRQAFMMTSSNGNIFRVTGPLCGEFIGPGEFHTQRPVTRSFDVFFDLRLNKRLSKQPWGWWFETLSWSLWRHCDVLSRDGQYRSVLQYRYTSSATSRMTKLSKS